MCLNHGRWQNQAMHVTLLPGADAGGAHTALERVRKNAVDVAVPGPQEPHRRLLAYLQWASTAVDELKGLISGADLNHLVLTRRYELLFGGVGSLAGSATGGVVNALVSLELQERIDALEETLCELSAERGLWQQRGYPVVADTSFYIQHPDKLELADLPAVVGVTDDSTHLIVPMVVVDELDRLKESKAPKVRWRAAYTLAVLDRLFQGGAPNQAVLREPDPVFLHTTGIRRGEVTVQILQDPPRHRRLSIADDEIVDRALTVKPFTQRAVRILTYDTGQAMRARTAGLEVVKPSVELEKEPAP